MIRRSTSTNCMASVSDPSKCSPEESSSCGGSYCLKPKRTDTSWEGACREQSDRGDGSADAAVCSDQAKAVRLVRGEAEQPCVKAGAKRVVAGQKTIGVFV
ncbi:hypothetical protein NL676_013706 [Syzygium grande]|nr:hypothetical protein NL676_013706 [Syzygium grande]